MVVQRTRIPNQMPVFWLNKENQIINWVRTLSALKTNSLKSVFNKTESLKLLDYKMTIFIFSVIVLSSVVISSVLIIQTVKWSGGFWTIFFTYFLLTYSFLHLISDVWCFSCTESRNTFIINKVITPFQFWISKE